MEEKLLNLKEGYENQRQQSEFGQQRAMETQRETYETGRQERGFEVARQAAGATRQFEAWKEKMNVDAKRYASDSAYAARVDSAYLRGAMSERASQNKGAGSGDWKAVNVNTAAMKPDPDHPGQMIPDLTAPPSQKPGITNKRTGRIYAPLGNKYLPWDNDKMGPAQTKGTSKAPPSAEEIADLIRDPNGVIPDGPNKGQYKADVFEAAHGFLPAPYFNAVTRGQGAGAAGSSSASSTESLALPSGRVFKGHVPAANVGGDFEQPGAQGAAPAQDTDET